jgi:hypothetical protein
MSLESFPQNWTARILTTPPLIAPARQYIYPQHIPGEEDAMNRGALLLDIKPAAAPNFLATCALGFRDPSLPTGIFACPRPEDLLAIAGFHTVLAIDANGIRWQSARLSWEGITLNHTDADHLHGTGWNLNTDREVPFTVDLLTGAHQGGGFTD